MTTVGLNIKRKREELGMTQEDLAKKLNYKSKSTINKIEMGINDITQSKVVAFAEALNTTPAYLMGWEAPTQNDFELNIIEKEIITKYRHSDEITREMVLRILKIEDSDGKKDVVPQRA